MTLSRVSTAALLLCLSGCAYGFTPFSSQVSRQQVGPLYSTTLHAAASNPFKKLPWNVEKEKKQQSRKMKLERSGLHRELGIAEDATYEELCEATDNLIARAGDDLKQKIKIEVAKDKILQIQLNERLAGLTAASADARAQSTFEVDGGDDDLVPQKKEETEWQAPRWTQGLVVKPDEKHRNGQIRLWGGVTFVGLAFPPAMDYLNRFTWLICIAQLTFRGMPREQTSGGGLGMNFNAGGGGKSHMKVAWLLGIVVSLFGAITTYTLMPAWAKGGRYTALLAFSMRNAIYAAACSYLQPYKG